MKELKPKLKAAMLTGAGVGNARHSGHGTALDGVFQRTEATVAKDRCFFPKE